MTVALVLADEADAGLRGRLAALGVQRVDATDRAGPGLIAVADAAHAAGERVLICAGDTGVPEEILACLLEAGGTAAFTGLQAPAARAARSRGIPPARPGGGALVVDTPDLDALCDAAESLAAAPAAPVAVGTLLGELRRRGVVVRVLDAGPDGAGAVAQLIVDPAARDVAVWAAGRALGPAALYGISLGLGLLAALWFADRATGAQVLAAVTLFGSFMAARTGAQLAAAGRDGRARPAVDWLGAASGLLTEFAVYAALAVRSGLAAQAGASGAGHAAGLDGIFGGALQNTPFASWEGAGTGGVWRLAVAAMLLLAVRRMAEMCYEAAVRAPGVTFTRSARRLLGQVIALPTGERYAVIAVTAVFFGPRLTFGVLLAWGAVSAGYVLARQTAGSARQARAEGVLPAYRGDGVVPRWLGGMVQGMLPPLLPVLTGLLVTCMLVVLGLANLPGILVLTPAVAMLPAALGARHPHNGPLDWLVPPLLLTGEGVFLAALGFSRQVPPPLVFVLLAAVIVRHADLAYRARSGLGVPADAFGLGWDVRMLLAGLAAVIGILPAAYAVLAGYLWLLFGWEFLSGWLRSAS
ncbi:MAG TPA: DUF5941 domain-containing protein [Streptosporangiaceae bacterium]|nr:DUF5941 domain-containing protein [Streptosporangiaceae bacterium]